MTIEGKGTPTRRAGKRTVNEVVLIELDRITTRSNVRQKWNQADFEKLVEDMRKRGQQMPGISFWDKERSIYIVADGHRRLEACRIVEVPFLTILLDHDPSEKELLDLQLSTFIHRSDVNQLDRARAYASAKQLHGFKTNKELAEHLCENEATISKLLTLLTLPEEAQRRVADGGSIEGTLKLFTPKPRRAKAHGKKRKFSLSKRRMVMLTAQTPIEDELAVEMLQELLRSLTGEAKDAERPVEDGIRLAELG